MPVTGFGEKSCKWCGAAILLKCKRDLERKNYCSKSCLARAGARTHSNRFAIEEPRKCSVCGAGFIAKHVVQKYCSRRCQGVQGARLLDKRRESLEWTLRKLAKRQISDTVKRDLDWQYLKGLYDDQQGKCAISGVAMTHEVGNGKVPTNISVDRIDSDAGYVEGNIQLVCRIVNQMKSNMTDAEFIKWCNLVSERSRNAS